MAALPNADNVDREIREIEKKVTLTLTLTLIEKKVTLTLTLTLIEKKETLTLTLTLTLTRSPPSSWRSRRPTARSTRWSRA